MNFIFTPRFADTVFAIFVLICIYTVLRIAFIRWDNRIPYDTDLWHDGDHTPRAERKGDKITVPTEHVRGKMARQEVIDEHKDL
jgi:hypothetical protein